MEQKSVLRDLLKESGWEKCLGPRIGEINRKALELRTIVRRPYHPPRGMKHDNTTLVLMPTCIFQIVG
jgi:hypothetical protein